MEKLIFETKISGTRVDLSEELREEMREGIEKFGYVTPKDIPDFVLYGIWWSVRGMSLQMLFKKDSDAVKIRQSQFNDTEMLTDYYSTSVYEILSGSLSHDDQIKVWLYKNKPKLWKQLVDHFGSDEKVFNNYVRFNH